MRRACCDKFGAGFVVGHVDRDEGRFRAHIQQLLDRVGRLVGVAAGNHHGGADRRHPFRHTEADTAITARHDGDAAFQIEQVH